MKEESRNSRIAADVTDSFGGAQITRNHRVAKIARSTTCVPARYETKRRFCVFETLWVKDFFFKNVLMSKESRAAKKGDKAQVNKVIEARGPCSQSRAARGVDIRVKNLEL